MPIYEYECVKCGHSLEVIQKISDAPLADCPGCGGKGGLKKLVSAAGFRLKGTGWYATDFKNSGKKPAPDKAGATGDKPAPSGTAAASESQGGADTGKAPGAKKTGDAAS